MCRGEPDVTAPLRIFNTLVGLTGEGMIYLGETYNISCVLFMKRASSCIIFSEAYYSDKDSSLQY